jgi:ribonuclease HII
MGSFRGDPGRPDTSALPSGTLPDTFRIGADENGLGSLLGPMLTTAVLAQVTEAGAKVVAGKLRGKLKERLGDSKALVAHGDVGLAEAWTRVLVRNLPGRDPESVGEVVAALSLDPETELRSICPPHVEAQCWSPASDAFVSDAPTLRQAERDLATLAKRGIVIRGLRSVINCNQRLNRALDLGQSRFAVDLHAMERLVLAFVEEAGQPVLAVCGKVGGYRQYEPVFGPLGARLRTVLREDRCHSAYFFPGVGELHFVEDADASDLLVSLSSLVGKYLREVLMDRVGAFYRREDPTLAVVSGYHDKVTQGFVAATRLSRKKRRIDDDCFLRRKAGD